MSQQSASAEFLKKAYDRAVDYAYIDEPQEALLKTIVEAVVMQLINSGVPLREDDPEYLLAVFVLSAYRYNRRTTIATNMGANDEDDQYTAMLRSWIWRLR